MCVWCVVCDFDVVVELVYEVVWFDVDGLCFVEYFECVGVVNVNLVLCFVLFVLDIVFFVMYIVLCKYEWCV